MLRCKINSAKEYAPGGPVFSVVVPNEIFGGARTTNWRKAESMSTRPVLVRAKAFAGAVTIARKILQQGESLVCFCLAGAAGLEWKGHSFGEDFVSGGVAAVARAQWFEIANHAETVTSTVQIDQILGAGFTTASSSK
jgi:hypothetical protein